MSSSDAGSSADAAGSDDARADSLPEWWCETHADCPAGSPYCSPVRHSCMQCGGEFSCPPDVPLCVSNWEDPAWLRCAECLEGKSADSCPSGEYCITSHPIDPAGVCEKANCGTAPTGAACSACRHENSAACLDVGGECEAEQAALVSCLAGETPLPGCDPQPPYYRRACLPLECRPLADVAADCVAQCTVVVAACQ